MDHDMGRAFLVYPCNAEITRLARVNLSSRPSLAADHDPPPTLRATSNHDEPTP